MIAWIASFNEVVNDLVEVVLFCFLCGLNTDNWILLNLTNYVLVAKKVGWSSFIEEKSLISFIKPRNDVMQLCYWVRVVLCDEVTKTVTMTLFHFSSNCLSTQPGQGVSLAVNSYGVVKTVNYKWLRRRIFDWLFGTCVKQLNWKSIVISMARKILVPSSGQDVFQEFSFEETIYDVVMSRAQAMVGKILGAR